MIDIEGRHVLIVNVNNDPEHETIAHQLANDVSRYGGIPILNSRDSHYVRVVMHYHLALDDYRLALLQAEYPESQVVYAGDVFNIDDYRGWAAHKAQSTYGTTLPPNHPNVSDINLHAAQQFEEYAAKLRKGLCQVAHFDNHTLFTSGDRPSGFSFAPTGVTTGSDYMGRMTFPHSPAGAPLNTTVAVLTARLTMTPQETPPAPTEYNSNNRGEMAPRPMKVEAPSTNESTFTVNLTHNPIAGKHVATYFAGKPTHTERQKRLTREMLFLMGASSVDGISRLGGTAQTVAIDDQRIDVVVSYRVPRGTQSAMLKRRFPQALVIATAKLEQCFATHEEYHRLVPVVFDVVDHGASYTIANSNDPQTQLTVEKVSGE